MHIDRCSRTKDTPLHVDRCIVILVELRPKVIFHTLKLGPSKWIILPHALYIRILSFIINTSHRDATDRIGGSANASEAILVVLKNLIHGVLPNAHQRVVNNLWVDGRPST